MSRAVSLWALPTTGTASFRGSTCQMCHDADVATPDLHSARAGLHIERQPEQTPDSLCLHVRKSAGGQHCLSMLSGLHHE